jgi:hypothetical protein
MKKHTLIPALLLLSGCTREDYGIALGLMIMAGFVYMIGMLIKSIFDYTSSIKKETKRIEILKMLSGVFLVLGIVSSLIILFTAGIVEESRGLFMGNEWKFYAGGIMSAIMTLFMSFFIYYGCRVIIYIAEQLTPKAEDKTQG